jgi:hypothetical protein
MDDQRLRAAAEGSPDADRMALRSLCRVVLNLNELVYVD